MAARFNEPLFVISVAARLVEMHPQTLRKYEKEGLIEPSRTSGNLRLYSDRDIERLRQVKYLVEGRGLNLAGVQLVLELTRRLREIRQQTEDLHQGAVRNSPQLRGGDSFAMLRDELDGVLRMLGFVEEPQRDDRRDGRPVLQ
ncbi:MAG: MerR family transcriptional regulator, heat shock protein HspR [Thermomicrobiales bacterium]|jgi:MerR family transcriptional regulator/heat shock protein HspR|nr:MerR family transcriptional regulator, heat shock protein HspR [Thermomicrobiales bacterium]MEA2524160.1 MerR family transcriptional regulator, heat shock protein HspR [Thermomicrobiales bacterium]MEA2530912.1 MerR family transcriptional regulator, heat shock protein HspR [Thermomicrobiales bacterium]MEA2586354.1 MerR family transcriptional regulator, heat shock protein HspR [Thermomicrobiales bacterium]